MRRAASSVVEQLRPEDRDSLVDAATQSLVGALERWARNPRLALLVGGVRRDVLTGPGESVEVVASKGVVGRLGAVARFIVDDDAVAEARLGPSGEISTVIEAPAPGLHTLRAEILAGEGTVHVDLGGQRTLHVASGRPVALIHAAMLLEASPTGGDHRIDAVRELSRAGFELAYVDVHDDDRYAEIRARLEQLGLPAGAILVHAADDRELDTLGVDFVQMFASTALRRLRSRGVPVTLIVTEQYPAGVREDGAVELMPPGEAVAAVAGDGMRLHTERAARLLQRKRDADPLVWTLDQTTASQCVDGNAFAVEFDNGRARRRLLDALQAASSSVHLQVYILRPGRFTDALVVQLIRRARAGVRIRLMVDALYSEEGVLGRANAAITSLRQEPNVEVVAVAPIDSRATLSVSRLKKRDHRKLVVVDGCRAFVSGRNASDEYYSGFDEVAIHDNTHHDRIPWLDAHVEVTGPLVGEIQRSFVETWTEQGGAPVDAAHAFVPLPPTGDAAGRLVVHRGFADTNGLSMYEAMLDAARDHAIIINDFPFVPAIERAIRRVLARGVRLQILTGSASARRSDGSFFPAPLHRTLFEYMVKAKLESLVQAGAEVREFVPAPSPLVVARGDRIRPYVHAKVVSVDGWVTSIGSANLDATASYWESEANIVVHDERFARDVESTIQSLFERSLPLDLDSEEWKRERSQRAVVAKLWPELLYS